MSQPPVELNDALVKQISAELRLNTLINQLTMVVLQWEQAAITLRDSDIPIYAAHAEVYAYAAEELRAVVKRANGAIG